MVDRNSPVGVFDSGVGGISTLGALKRELPGEDFRYFGDTKNAPYICFEAIIHRTGTKGKRRCAACIFSLRRQKIPPR